MQTVNQNLKRWDNNEIIHSGNFKNIKELVEDAVKKEINLEYANLYKANLKGADLEKANLESAILEGASLKNANLKGASLEGADLENANLYTANLRKANLYNADLKNANLENAIFYNANLKGANLYNADLENANLYNANLYKAILENANLKGANLDFSCMPLWCGDLTAHYDDKQIIQQLYHVLSHVKYSSNCSDELKKVLLTNELKELANKFHRVDECGEV